MCFSAKTPDIPDPKLPKQPIQRQEPASFSVGRNGEDRGTDRIKANRSRRRLRIRRSDNVSAQVSGAPSGPGVQM